MRVACVAADNDEHIAAEGIGRARRPTDIAAPLAYTAVTPWAALPAEPRIGT